MPTRNIVIPDPLSYEIDRLVASGRYQNASEVVRNGLRLLIQQEAMVSAKVEALRNATGSALEQLEQGRFDEVNGGDLEQYLEGLSVEDSRIGH
ncbi:MULTISPECIES: type II toxin-antitoxin system ParD family antitoxin [Pseudomonadaceae]|uniref:type II toxin-antitoxin system ParD family antitoxin n=1 Tax=Pseudomonadaceae TaxID=135621 RepID=UPI000489AD1C|nr:MULTISPECIES: type II toxin-antitoxin system ParD family antitoxin [Pseudomonas]WCE10224.1 type II toxin-antitoxin system ParD family antitoxin [Pseudomonas sp. JBR1]